MRQPLPISRSARPGGPPRVLMVAPFCYPPISAEAIVNAKLVSAMLAQGWEVTVLGEEDPSHAYYPSTSDEWEDLHDVVVRVPNASAARAYAGIAGMVLRREPTQRTAMRWIVPAIEAGVELAATRGFEVIISRSHPDFAHVVAFAIGQRTGLPWLANWNDPAPWEKCPPPYAQGAEAPWRWYQRWRFRRLVEGAAWHTFPCERLRRYVCSYMPAEMASKSSVIPHVARGAPPAARSPRPEGFTLCHAGDMSEPRDPVPLLEALRTFLVRHPEAPVRLRLIGRRPRGLDSEVRRLALGEVVSAEPPAHYRETLSRVAEAAVAVIVEADLAEGIFFPSKLVDYAELGRPILAIGPREGTVRDHLEVHPAGVAARASDPADIVQALERLYQSWRTGQLEKAFQPQRLLSQFSPSAVLALHEEVIRRVAGRSGTPARAS